MACKVGRGCHQHALAGRQGQGDQPRILDHAVADDRIVALGSSVHPPVIQFQRQRNARVACQERVQRGPKMHTAKRDRGRQAHRATERAAPLGDLGHGVLHFPHDAICALEEGGAVFCQAELARGPMEKGRAQALFKIREAFANHRFGKMQPPRRRADRAGFGYRYKARDAIQFHHDCSIIPNISSAF